MTRNADDEKLVGRLKQRVRSFDEASMAFDYSMYSKRDSELDLAVAARIETGAQFLAELKTLLGVSGDNTITRAVFDLANRALAAESKLASMEAELARVRADERERCARIAEDRETTAEDREADPNTQYHDGYDAACFAIAAAIRNQDAKKGNAT